jgi:L-ascorbate metabolism protein UlaG (beta-lactamase superfamily)
VLFDPVLEHRCSPFSWLGPQRYTPSPCDVADLPVVDAVLISHNHYDHLSSPTVQQIATRFPGAHFFVPLGLEKWFHSAGITNVTELDWWEGADLTLAPKRLERAQNMDGDSVKSAEGHTITARVSCLPSQHTSRRTGLDTDATLWCSWAVSSSSGPSPEPCSVYFAGDTGYRAVPRIASGKTKDGSPLALDPAADYEPPYDTLPVCPQFAQVGELRGPFDLGLLPIGAYKPRQVMSHMHCNPFDAVELFRDTRCKRAMGIHWGTWMLTAEDVMEPPELLKLALRRRGIDETGVFDVCDIGESREF